MEKAATYSDEELMELYQRGNYSAFTELYHRHSGRVYEYLRKKTTAPAAQELMQESFLKLHNSRAQYSSEYPFLPWLFTISRNVLFDFFRLNETKVANTSSAEKLFTIAANNAETFSDETLVSALSHLPIAQRRAIELRYLNEWSFEKIAADLKTSPLNVRQLISRGLKKVKARFGVSE